mmetsp:Transcript_52812/g.128038  ORF Transcript_52812/g.128038 Transcript_52812/m.128038 type:complete len:351 (+) Transcript_52812:2260-3312(+)
MLLSLSSWLMLSPSSLLVVLLSVRAVEVSDTSTPDFPFSCTSFVDDDKDSVADDRLSSMAGVFFFTGGGTEKSILFFLWCDDPDFLCGFFFPFRSIIAARPSSALLLSKLKPGVFLIKLFLSSPRRDFASASRWRRATIFPPDCRVEEARLLLPPVQPRSSIVLAATGSTVTRRLSPALGLREILLDFTGFRSLSCPRFSSEDRSSPTKLSGRPLDEDRCLLRIPLEVDLAPALIPLAGDVDRDLSLLCFPVDFFLFTFLFLSLLLSRMLLQLLAMEISTLSSSLLLFDELSSLLLLLLLPNILLLEAFRRFISFRSSPAVNCFLTCGSLFTMVVVPCFSRSINQSSEQL